MTRPQFDPIAELDMERYLKMLQAETYDEWFERLFG